MKSCKTHWNRLLRLFFLVLLAATTATAQDDAAESLFDLEEEDAVQETDITTSVEATPDAAMATEETPEQLSVMDILERAHEMYNQGQYLEAISAYSAVLLDPRLATMNQRDVHAIRVQAYVRRGMAFVELNIFDLALKSFGDALALSRTNPLVLNERGKLYMKMKKYKDALDDFESTVALYPTNTEYLKNYGTASIKFGEYQSNVLGDIESGAENVSKGISSLSTVIDILNSLSTQANFFCPGCDNICNLCITTTNAWYGD